MTAIHIYAFLCVSMRLSLFSAIEGPLLQRWYALSPGRLVGWPGGVRWRFIVCWRGDFVTDVRFAARASVTLRCVHVCVCVKF